MIDNLYILDRLYVNGFAKKNIELWNRICNYKQLKCKYKSSHWFRYWSIR